MGVAPDVRLAAVTQVTGLSHALWMPVAFPVGGTEPETDFQILSASSS